MNEHIFINIKKNNKVVKDRIDIMNSMEKYRCSEDDSKNILH